MEKTCALKPEDLRKPFLKTSSADAIGIEVEVAAVDPETGQTRSYEEPAGIRALLEALIAEGPWTPGFEGPNVIALDHPDGHKITLEPGGAVEYSSAPADALVPLVETMNATLAVLSARARELGTALLATGGLPFNRLEDTKWMPKGRYRIMRDYFTSLGDVSRLALRMMTQTLSVQTSVDYGDPVDLARKFHGLSLVAPIATALFANSPLEEGKDSGFLSRRGEIWRFTDPDRSGFVPPALQPGMSVDDYVEWALDVPAMFRIVGSEYRPMHGKTFRAILHDGFPDGSAPTVDDWVNHINGIFTDVRLKNVLEIRSMDGQAYSDIPSVPAFFSGLTYHRPSLDGAIALLSGLDRSKREAALADICRRGLHARHGDASVLELSRELVRLAREGLEARIADGLEQPGALAYLAPVEEIVATGRTRAEDLLDRWTNDWKGSRKALIDALRLP